MENADRQCWPFDTLLANKITTSACKVLIFYGNKDFTMTFPHNVQRLCGQIYINRALNP